MISVSDVLKILDEIPIWKAVASLPKRVAELERFVAALEANQVRKLNARTGKECAFCGAQMHVIAEKVDPVFGAFGVKCHTMQCPACEQISERQFNPQKGYTS